MLFPHLNFERDDNLAELPVTDPDRVVPEHAVIYPRGIITTERVLAGADFGHFSILVRDPAG